MRRILRDIFLRTVGSFRSPKPGIHLLNSHYVSPKLPSSNDSTVFRNFLNILTSKCQLIDFQEATRRILHNEIPLNGTYVALSFDDGFKECYSTIAPILDEYGCKAAFFINANYVSSNANYQNDFNQRVNTFSKLPMNWDEISDLHERGHIIGGHTLDHLDLGVLNDSQLHLQLSQNKKILEERLRYSCDYFAWPYGRFENFGLRALGVASTYYKYIFSATNYRQYFSINGRVLNRRHIEPFWPKSHIHYFLSFTKSKGY
ncbi:polysaccharide deacetylase family protein [Gracilibacillus dipsosauri]|uniref:polysaccharide deacetylase family protein n=1 Tax=Gracilibacillus dipsosauri TaxID=178340 RepID=UPI00240A12E4